MQYTYDENNNRIRKLQTGNDEYYILGLNGQTESVFDENGNAKFYNINNGGEIIGRMIPPVNNLTLTNTTLVGNYKASNSITAETNVSVTGTAVLKAGNTINLKPGFTANSGCNLTISVGTVTSDKYYYLKDHLGSIRVVVDTVGEIVSYDDYDPYGMQLAGRSANFGFANDKYKYVGNERDNETGYDYLGDRYYDSRIGKLFSLDPFADKDPSRSPYSYAGNNPIIFYDANGDSVEVSSLNQEQLNEYNNFLAKVKESQRFEKLWTSLIRSKSIYRIISDKNKKTGYDPNSFDQGSGGIININALDIYLFTHESYHAYQHDNMNLLHSTGEEVEAYLFSESIGQELLFPTLTVFGNDKFGNYSKSLFNNFTDSAWRGAIKTFKSSSLNSDGRYNDFNTNYYNPILIKQMYPLWR